MKMVRETGNFFNSDFNGWFEESECYMCKHKLKTMFLKNINNLK